MTDAETLASLLSDPNLLPSEREAIQRLLSTTIREHATTNTDAPAANVDAMRPIVAIDGTPRGIGSLLGRPS